MPLPFRISVFLDLLRILDQVAFFEIQERLDNCQMKIHVEPYK